MALATSYDIFGLEEDSSYTITVTASNSAGNSAVSNTLTAMTLEAGERLSLLLFTSIKKHEMKGDRDGKSVKGVKQETACRMYAYALAQTAPLLSRRLVTRQWRLFEESVGRL